jgi:hypothetical protein
MHSEGAAFHAHTFLGYPALLLLDALPVFCSSDCPPCTTWLSELRAKRDFLESRLLALEQHQLRLMGVTGEVR